VDVQLWAIRAWRPRNTHIYERFLEGLEEEKYLILEQLNDANERERENLQLVRDLQQQIRFNVNGRSQLIGIVALCFMQANLQAVWLLHPEIGRGTLCQSAVPLVYFAGVPHGSI
jgi:ABC-type protease/lipase transport system fused ATPase/permease subunit